MASPRGGGTGGGAAPPVGPRQSAGAVLRLGRVPRRRRVPGQRRPAHSGVWRPGVSAASAGARHRCPPPRHRQACSCRAARALDAPPRKDGPGGSARLSHCRHRHRRRHLRPRQPRLEPPRSRRRRGAARDLGTAPGVFTRATGRGRWAPLRHPRRAGVPAFELSPRIGAGRRAVWRRVRVQQPPVVPAAVAGDRGDGLLAWLAASSAARFRCCRGVRCTVVRDRGRVPRRASRRPRRGCANGMARLRPAIGHVLTHESARPRPLRRVADLLRRYRACIRPARCGCGTSRWHCRG